MAATAKGQQRSVGILPREPAISVVAVVNFKRAFNAAFLAMTCASQKYALPLCLPTLVLQKLRVIRRGRWEIGQRGKRIKSEIPVIPHLNIISETASQVLKFVFNIPRASII